MERVNIRIEGASPLLINRMTPEQLEKLWAPDGKKYNVRPQPRDAANSKVYRTQAGEPYVPAEMFYACLIAAGQFLRLDGKRQMSSAKSTNLPAFVQLEDPFMLLKTRAGAQATWEVDLRQGRNPNGGEAVCIVRPRFDDWMFEASLLVDVQAIAEDKIRELVDLAGSRCGLGDFRPQRRGTYGRFRVACWARAKLQEAAE